jgi:opacity protein-like surface antigen
VHQGNKSLYQPRFQFIALISVLLLPSKMTLANTFSLNHSQLEQYISLTDEDVLLKPAGEGVFLSLDLNDEWQVKFDYQTWQDNKHAISPIAINLDLISFGGGLSYVGDNWYASTNIGYSEDDISYRANQSRADNRQNKTQITALSASIGNNWLAGNWMFDLSMAVQYADWTVEKVTFNNERAQQDGKPAEEISTNNSDSASISAGFSAARYWQLTQEQGVLVGVIFSWNYEFSGDESLRADGSPPPRRTAGQQAPASNNINSNPSRITSGDDNYGQVMTYLSYDINNDWSVDLDTAVEVATTNNNLSWSVGVSYSF